MKRRVGAVLVAVGMLAGFVGCGDDGEGGGGGEIAASRRLASAGGDAVAADGSGLDEAPGPADRESLDAFGTDDVEFDEVAIAIRAPDGSVMGWCVLVADTEERRARGLMEVTDFGGYPGMLFVWNTDSSSQFYMRNTPTPLSIAWFDREGELVSTADMEPCGDDPDCPLYGTEGGQPYRFALEVPQGELASLGVEEGSVLRVGGDCAARSP